MADTRIKNIVQSTTYSNAVINDGKVLLDWNGLASSIVLPIKELGNCYIQGSADGSTYSTTINESTNYLRFSTDGGVIWRNIVVGDIADAAKVNVENEFTEGQTITVSGNNAEILKFNIENPWLFKQVGTGTSAYLALQSIVDGKQFQIKSADDTPAINFLVNNSGSSIEIDGNLVYNSGNSNSVGIDWNANNLTLGGYIGTDTFVSGFSGNGWRLQNNHLTVDNLTVRETLEVYELIIDQIRSSNGAISVSDSAKIVSVTETTTSWILYIDTDNSVISVPFLVDDIVKCQIWTGSNVKMYKGVVSAVFNDHFTIQKSSMGSTVGQPSVGDTVVRVDSLSDVDRKGNIYLTSSDDNSPYIDIIYGAESGDSTTLITAPLFITDSWIASSATIVDEDTFSTAASGGIIKSGILETNKYYKISITGSTTASSLTVVNGDNTFTFMEGVTGAFVSGTIVVKYTGTDTGIYIRNAGAGTTDITSLSIIEYDAGYENSIKARLGKLEGIISPTWGDLTDKWGIYTNEGYFENVHVSGVLVVDTGSVIAGWNIEEDAISKNNIEISSTGYIRSNNGTIDLWRLNNDGSGLLSSGNISWDALGELTVAGTINATSGSIGNFTISGGSDGYYGSLISDADDVYIRAGTGTRFAAIGSGTFPSTMGGTDAVGLFMNTTASNYTTNYGIYAQASNAGTGGSAYAGYFVGNVHSTGSLSGINNIPNSHISNLSDTDNSYMSSGYYLFVGDNKTGDRNYYLPYANAYKAGDIIRIVNWNDQNGYFHPRGSDTINGYTDSQKYISLLSAPGAVELRSNGSNQWMIISLSGADSGF